MAHPTNADEVKERWIAWVMSDPRTGDHHHLAAAILAHTSVAPPEHVEAADQLVVLGFLVKNPDGTYATVDPAEGLERT